MLVPITLLDELRVKNRALSMAVDGVDRAKGEVLRAEDNLRQVAQQQRDAYEAAALGVLACWLRDKVKGMSLAEEHAFVNELGCALHTKWRPRDGSIEEEYKRMDWLRDIGVEVFGKHLGLFAEVGAVRAGASAVLHGAYYELSECKSASDAEKDVGNRAYSLVCEHLENALKNRYVAICGVWRADPADPYDWRKRDAREHSWRIALREHPVRYVLTAVFDELQRAGRVKSNGQEWARFSKSEWSFRNSATVDVDIDKAIEAASGEAAFAKVA